MLAHGQARSQRRSILITRKLARGQRGTRASMHVRAAAYHRTSKHARSWQAHLRHACVPLQEPSGRARPLAQRHRSDRSRRRPSSPRSASCPRARRSPCSAGCHRAARRPTGMHAIYRTAARYARSIAARHARSIAARRTASPQAMHAASALSLSKRACSLTNHGDGGLASPSFASKGSMHHEHASSVSLAKAASHACAHASTQHPHRSRSERACTLEQRMHSTSPRWQDSACVCQWHHHMC